MTTQRILIARINELFRNDNRSISYAGGYCHGLTLLWLYYINQKNENEFSRTLEKIIFDNELSLDNHSDIDKFVSQLEWLQHSLQYESGVNQFDFDDLMEVKKAFSLSLLLKYEDIKNILDKIINDNNMVILSGSNHTVGVYARNHELYYYDADTDCLRAIKLSKHELNKQLVKSLYHRNYVPDVKLTIHIHVVSSGQSNLYTDKYTKLINTSLTQIKNINEFGLDHITHLHLAVEAGNESIVSYLLSHGADPHKLSYGKWNAFDVARLTENEKMGELLTRHGIFTTDQNQRLFLNNKASPAPHVIINPSAKA